MQLKQNEMFIIGLLWIMIDYANELLIISNYNHLYTLIQF